MKGVWTVLIALGAAVAYGVASHAVSGAWNFSLAFVIGAVVALALSGFRVRPDAESEDRPTVSPVSSQPQSPGDAVVQSGDSGADGVRDLSAQHHSTPAPDACTSSPSPQPSTANLPPTLRLSGETAEELWNRAREMAHNVIPDFVKDAGYLDLVYSAAELGYVPALAKLGEYAVRRGAFVEAYFWTKMARRRAELTDGESPLNMKEIDGKLRNIRREWAAAGQPPEFENVYENFPEERGELGRAFLRLDAGIEAWRTRKFVQRLADKGNPDAALFVG